MHDRLPPISAAPSFVVGEKVAFSGSKAAEVIVTKAALFLSSLANALKIVLFQLQSALLSISFRTSKAEKTVIQIICLYNIHFVLNC